MSSAPNLLRRVGASPTVAEGGVFDVGANHAKLGLVPKLRNRFGVLPQPSPKETPAFKGLEPDERNRFGVLSARSMSSAPNLLRRVGASPTVAEGGVFDVGANHAKLGLVPKLRNRFGVLPQRSPKETSLHFLNLSEGFYRSGGVQYKVCPRTWI